ncbi:patatin-like protein 1 [Tanacetum coccineum]|uniref:Patatin-like protein 1 n=1 Tax=Tanacetum coccineum TaxID=301880 RepID=A0ABQ4XST0_9ASTR
MDYLLWNDLKTMFEPHVEDAIWRNQQGYKVLEWKWYDSCGYKVNAAEGVNATSEEVSIAELCLIAISEVIRQVTKENPDYLEIPPMDYKRYLVISLGTGAQKQQPRYDTKMAAKWGVLGWIVNNNSSPLIGSYSQASTDLVVFHNNVVFEALNYVDNYLRIQGISGSEHNSGEEERLNRPYNRQLTTTEKKEEEEDPKVSTETRLSQKEKKEAQLY